MADTLVLGTSAARCESSSLSERTKFPASGGMADTPGSNPGAARAACEFESRLADQIIVLRLRSSSVKSAVLIRQMWLVRFQPQAPVSDSIAQLAEWRSPKPQVGGSMPSRVARHGKVPEWLIGFRWKRNGRQRHVSSNLTFSAMVLDCFT